MKKKIRIIIGSFVLFSFLTSCEQDEEINSYKSAETVISVDKNTTIPLEPTTLSKDEIADNSCDIPIETVLYAGQNKAVGKVYISNNKDEVFITYDTRGSNWWIKETHVYVGDIDDAEFNNGGNPKIGKFPYHGDHDLTQLTIFTIPIKDFKDCFSVISHAVVVSKVNGEVHSSETAFGYGDNEFPGNRWGWYLDYCQQICDNTDDGNPEGDTGNGGTGNGDTGNGDTGGNDGGQSDQNGCMDAFAYNNLIPGNSSCFTDDGFDSWGWTNLVSYNPSFDHPDGYNQRFPLYASAFQCDITNSMDIGYLELSVLGGDGRYYANIKIVLLKKDLLIKDLNLYVGTTNYPIDSNGIKTISYDQFNISLNEMNVIEYSISNLEWADDTYFIGNIKVCPPPLQP